MVLDLSGLTGRRAGVAVDTRRPYLEIPIGEIAPGRRTWTAPRRSDWVIAVGSFAFAGE